MINQRITQQDIAEAAGVSRSTVTYALNGHPKIPEQTRARIESIARNLGYVPDPMLASLAYYRNKKRDTTYRGLLAWLVYRNKKWRDSPHYRGYFRGAQQQALRHGYQLEEFYFDPSETKVPRMVSILLSRGINGILLCPLPQYGMQVQFDWKHFSTIAFGYTLKSPRLHSVAAAHFSNIRQALSRLRRRGYRRIGLVIDQITDLRCNSAISSGFLGQPFSSSNIKPTDQISVHYEAIDQRFTPASLAALADYLTTHSLDAVITEDITILERLRQLKLSVPKDIAVAGLSLLQADKKLGGIVEISEHIGAHAVDLLTAMVQRGERGIPPYPVRSHVEGIWTDGKSVRNQRKAPTRQKASVA